MAQAASNTYPLEVRAMAGPITRLLRYGMVDYGEAALAALTLWILDAVEAQQLRPETADDVFTYLDIYLTDQPVGLELSEEAQELIFEGEHLHHFGGPWGPDPKYVRELASKILERARS